MGRPSSGVSGLILRSKDLQDLHFSVSFGDFFYFELSKFRSTTSPYSKVMKKKFEIVVDFYF